MNNRFAWFGTTKRFDTLTQTSSKPESAIFNAHHYRYAPERSTFIVEIDEATFARAGFERMDEGDARELVRKGVRRRARRRAADLQQLDLAAAFRKSCERALVSTANTC